MVESESQYFIFFINNGLFLKQWVLKCATATLSSDQTLELLIYSPKALMGKIIINTAEIKTAIIKSNLFYLQTSCIMWREVSFYLSTRVTAGDFLRSSSVLAQTELSWIVQKRRCNVFSGRFEFSASWQMQWKLQQEENTGAHLGASHILSFNLRGHI